MERKQIIVFPVGSLDPKTKELLSKNGYLAIEASDPKAVVTVLPTAALTSHASGDQIVSALIDAAFGNEYCRKDFGTALLKMLKTSRPDGQR